jgi:hypothetical protein
MPDEIERVVWQVVEAILEGKKTLKIPCLERKE